MTVVERKLIVPEGYDSSRNPRVASFAAQFEELTTRLKRDTADLETRHLEWQLRPGMNTIGMLLAHLAIVEIWWIRLAPHGPTPEESETAMKEILGIGGDDDGLPLAAGGRHPGTLAGKSLADYYRMLDAARATVHAELRTWQDSDLPVTYALRDRVISREWTVYHVLEHYAGHYGQILLLKHLMRDEGVLPAPQK